jgi:hypothetical protein
MISFRKYNIIITLLLAVILAWQIICHLQGMPIPEELFEIFCLLVAFDIGVFFVHFNIIEFEELD